MNDPGTVPILTTHSMTVPGFVTKIGKRTLILRHKISTSFRNPKKQRDLKRRD